MTYRISKFVYTIATKFQRLCLRFLNRSTRLDYCWTAWHVDLSGVKMASVVWKLICATFDSNKSLCRRVSTASSQALLPNLENMGITLGNPLLSYTEAEVDVMAILYSRLMAAVFDFQHTHVSDSIPTGFSVLPVLRKHRFSRRSFVIMVYRSWYIRYIISTPGYWPPSSIYRTQR